MAMKCPKQLEQYRVKHPLTGCMGDESNGALNIKPFGKFVIFSSEGGWEHVSVSRRSRMPSYDDLISIRKMFWDDDDCVMQLFVPSKDHININQFCLHLWRPINGQEIPRPPGFMV